MDNIDKSPTVKKSVHKLCSAIHFYGTLCPALARTYVDQVEDLIVGQNMDVSSIANNLCCQHCGTLYQADNHKVWVVPKMTLNKKIAQLLTRKYNTKNPLGRFQQKLVDMYSQSQNRVVISCQTCGKRTVIPGGKRKEKIQKVEIEEPILNRAAKRKLKKKFKRKQNKLVKEAGENTTDLCSTSRTALIAAQPQPPSQPQEGVGQSKQPSTPLLTSTPVLSRAHKPGLARTGLSPHISTVSLISAISPAPRISTRETGMKSTKNKITNKKDKKNLHNVLHKLLAKDKKQKEAAQPSESLQHFLSGL